MERRKAALLIHSVVQAGVNRMIPGEAREIPKAEAQTFGTECGRRRDLVDADQTQKDIRETRTGALITHFFDEAVRRAPPWTRRDDKLKEHWAMQYMVWNRNPRLRQPFWGGEDEQHNGRKGHDEGGNEGKKHGKRKKKKLALPRMSSNMRVPS